MAVAKVIVDLALDKEFDYEIPEELAERVKVGTMVSVPFGKSRREGYVLSLAETSSFAGTVKPILGICRGLQLLNVYFGGTLHQHILGHAQVCGRDHLHIVHAAPGLLRALYGARFTVNSAHHQAVETLGGGLKVLACAPDGTVEAIAHKALPAFAVQWHPERLCGAFSRPETVDGAALLSALLR